MKKNIGSTERVARLVLGIAIFAIAISYQSWWSLVGLEIALTGIFGWSPVYRLFSFSTGPGSGHRYA